MSGPNPARTKADERRLRNLASANSSRQRRREQISSLEQERARLKEANELLRARLNLMPSAVLPAQQTLRADPTPDKQPNKIENGLAVGKVSKNMEIDPKVAVDLLDRALTGGKGKGTPLDPELLKNWQKAAKKIPRDAQRPYVYYDPDKGSSSKSGSKPASKPPTKPSGKPPTKPAGKTTGKAGKSKAGSSKSKGSASGKKR